MDDFTRHSKTAVELTASELHDILRLRTDVFVVEQACIYPEVDGRDMEPGTRHLWVSDDEGIVSYIRVLDNGDSRQIGRVVTRPSARGAGHAAPLINAALAAQPGAWTLESQSHLTHFYERLGFEVSGAEYVEDGIPHVPMTLRKSSSNGV